MVTKKIIRGKEHYRCDGCDLVYSDKNLAKKCELWCKKYNSCNLEIIKHAVQ